VFDEEVNMFKKRVEKNPTLLNEKVKMCNLRFYKNAFAKLNIVKVEFSYKSENKVKSVKSCYLNDDEWT
jgi:hypothetical protein